MRQSSAPALISVLTHAGVKGMCWTGKDTKPGRRWQRVENGVRTTVWGSTRDKKAREMAGKTNSEMLGFQQEEEARGSSTRHGSRCKFQFSKALKNNFCFKKNVIDFREIEECRERNIDFCSTIYAFFGWVLYVSWPGIDPTTLAYWDDTPTNWATQPGPSLLIFHSTESLS